MNFHEQLIDPELHALNVFNKFLQYTITIG
jgi:hypothetical protein